MTDKNQLMALQIAQAVAEKGGSVYYVGGFVRDQLLGRENKDVDIEVHGITPGTLEAILDTVGERTEMGASFGVYGLRHYDLDIAMPRKEQATGKGHKDFSVFTDPFLGTQKAAMRRDFTINALMQDVITGDIVDHFGGCEDARQGVLRHVDDVTFAEDPLRVLRAAQFAARLGFSIADETIALCRQMDLRYLARERIWGEMEKALMKSSKPSVFFESLRVMDQLHFWFPEVEALIDVPQDARFHPEGSVWNHTMLVLDQAAKRRMQAKYPLDFMLAALCHDFGKAVTTCMEDGVIRARKHETEGLPIVDCFLFRLTTETRKHQYVRNMTELHMRPRALFKQCAGQKAVNHLFDQSLCPEDLLLLSEADMRGRANAPDDTAAKAFLNERLAVFRDMMARPCVMGSDLLAAGFQPGKDFSEALAYAHKMRLAGVDKETALQNTIGYLRKMRHKKQTTADTE